MNCLHCNKHMYNYFDDDLSPQLKLEIDNHLLACPSCRFQYDLTLEENQILQDTSDIPELSPGFNKLVMDAITREKLPYLPNNVLVMSKDKRLHFRWSSVYTASAIAVLLFTLCCFVPGIITGDQEQQKIAQNNNATKFSLNTANDEAARTAGIAMQDLLLKQNVFEQDYGSSLQWGAQDRNATSSSNTPQPKLEAANPQLLSGSRIAFSEAGRSERKEVHSDRLSIASLNLKNIPEKYKLVEKLNSIENQIEYSYQTDDGAEMINIHLITIPPQALAMSSESLSPKEAKPMMSLAAPAAAVAEIANREIQVGDQKIAVQISGNISSDELNNLANNLIISKNP